MVFGEVNTLWILLIFSGNNCQLPRSRPYVSVLMEFPSVPRSNNNNGQSNTKFWSSVASHSPGRPQSLLNGHHHHNGHAPHQPPGICALYACAVSCVRLIVDGARDCVSRGQGAPSRVYGISSDTLSSDNRFHEDPNSQAPRESPPYLPSEPRRHLNGHHGNGNGIGTVRDLPV